MIIHLLLFHQVPFIDCTEKRHRSEALYDQGLHHVWKSSNIRQSKFHKWTKELPPERLCEWPVNLSFMEFTCHDGILVEFMIDKCPEIGNIQIWFFSDHLKVLKITDSYQMYYLSTRMFPRNAVSIDLSKNRLHGTPDLRELPQSLEKLLLHRNVLTGPIRLDTLPPSLQILNLENNDIHQRTVWFTYPFGNVFLEGNKIRAARALPGVVYANEDLEKIKGVKKVIVW